MPRRVNRSRARKEERKVKVAELAEERAKRSISEQLELIKKRPGESKKETARLLKQASN